MPMGRSSRYHSFKQKQASILTAEIVTSANLQALVFNPICHQFLCRSDGRVKLLITKSKRNKITPSHNHATLLLHKTWLY